jgi:hypothetical protein
MPFAPVMQGAPDPGAAANNGHTGGALASHSAAARHDDAPAAVADAWIPPDGDDLFARPTSPPDQAASERTAGAMSGRAAPEWPTQPVIVPADRDFPTYDTRTPHDETSSAGDLTENAPFERSTAPVPAAVPTAPPTAPPSTQLPVVSGGLTRPEERALGAVLVEGALISPRKLEVLQGIQRMLTTVEMDFKLGELALLFKFLSPDQLLAALLVSRRLVSPQQIAALGRIKQELGGSGINYDLETLLVMFHILSRDELSRLRDELA